MVAKPKPKPMPRKVQTSLGPGPMETIVIEDLETGQQAQHETGLEEQPPPEEAEEDAAMYEAVLQASYRRKNKGEKRIKSLIEQIHAKKKKGLWQGPPQPIPWDQLEWHKRAPVPVEKAPVPVPVENQVSPHHGARINPAIGNSPKDSCLQSLLSKTKMGQQFR